MPRARTTTAIASTSTTVPTTNCPATASASRNAAALAPAAVTATPSAATNTATSARTARATSRAGGSAATVSTAIDQWCRGCPLGLPAGGLVCTRPMGALLPWPVLFVRTGRAKRKGLALRAKDEAWDIGWEVARDNRLHGRGRP